MCEGFAIKFTSKPPGGRWQDADVLYFPQIFSSRSEAEAAFVLAGDFEYAAKARPDLFRFERGWPRRKISSTIVRIKTRGHS